MPVQHVVLASGAVVAVSVAVATALAMYENPELRRYADDIRRRVAMALHSLGNGINPPERDPMFNRPEDAEGFLLSSRGVGAEPGVDADEETRRRQRDDLMYWNSLRLKSKNEDGEPTAALSSHTQQASRPQSGTLGSTTFDDILSRDETAQPAQSGTHIISTGADVRDRRAGLRHRGGLAAPSMAAPSMYANPFADENHLDHDEVADLSASCVPGEEDSGSKQDHMSDIYSATTRDNDHVESHTVDGSPAVMEMSSPRFHSPLMAPTLPTQPTLERQLAADEYMTASQGDGNEDEAYASIQAWAHDSSCDVFSPLPEIPSPAALDSEPDILSEGLLTPTDSVSVIGSGEMALARDGTQEDVHGPFDDVSGESDGFLTPASWSDVGSVVSENDAHGHFSAYVDTPFER